MADLDVPDVDIITSVVEGHLMDGSEAITVVSCTPQEAVLLNASGSGEPSAKRLRLDADSLVNTPDANSSVKQILFNINQAICLRLDAIENKLETVTNATKLLEDKIEQLAQNRGSPSSDNANTSASLQTTPGRDSMSSTPLSHRRGGAMVVGLPQSVKGASANDTFTDDEEIQQERYVVSLAGDNPGGSRSNQGIQNLGPNVTLITLNSEDDFPNGTWLGDENNPEMRVRVPISPSDLLHVHSNCRTAEKMALTLLDYLFDRETQAYSNLSGMGKHGKKQLDPLMIYGIRCHLIHHFSITEQDWHRIKQNVNSKCRTAFRRKVRGLPLTVKAFRGKAPPTYIHVSASGMPLHHGVRDLGDTSDDSMQHADDSELQIQTEVDVSQAGLNIAGTTTEIIQSAGGHIQVLHATPEQVAQLQQTHQIQILQGDQIMQFHTGGDQDSIHVAVPMSQADSEHIQIINSENGETIQIAPHMVHDISQEVVTQHMPKVEDASDSEQD